jgi:hypothetical protein
MMRVWLALVCAAAVGAGSLPPLPKTNAGQAKAAITLERTACYGHCPVYRVTVRGDGRVEWHGTRDVAAIGARTRTIPKARVAVLLRTLDEGGFLGWNESYEKRRITDLPSQVLTVEWSGTKKTVRHYVGDDSAPKKLDAVMALVDDVAGTAAWVGKR